jgi:hypothetical protein
MKKLKTHYAIILFITAYFLFNGCINRTEEKDWQKYAIELQNEGYTVKASEHIAKVEFKLLPIDEEYIGLIED